MPRRTRLLHLDLFRALAIIAVLVIHTTSSPVSSLPKHSQLYPLYFVANSFCQFAVPAFLFLSSLVLFYNYYKADRIDWKGFYWKRLRFIVVPYLILSFLYFASDALIDGASLWERMPLFLKRLLFGENYFHLYFVVILLQFFILFPLMLAAARRCSRLVLAAIGIGLQLAFYLANYYIFDIERVGSFVGSYLLYLFLGACAGIALQGEPGGERRRSGMFLYPTLALLAAAFLLQLWMQRAYPHWIGQPWLSMIHSLTKYAFCAVCCFALLRLSGRIRLSRQAWSGRMLLLLGETSFGIYLIHPFILLMWRREVMMNGPLVYHLLIWAGGAAALGLSWLLTVWFQRRSWGVYLIGGRTIRAASTSPEPPSAKPAAGGYGLRKT